MPTKFRTLPTERDGRCAGMVSAIATGGWIDPEGGPSQRNGAGRMGGLACSGCFWLSVPSGLNPCPLRAAYSFSVRSATVKLRLCPDFWARSGTARKFSVLAIRRLPTRPTDAVRRERGAHGRHPARHPGCGAQPGGRARPGDAPGRGFRRGSSRWLWRVVRAVGGHTRTQSGMHPRAGRAWLAWGRAIDGQRGPGAGERVVGPRRAVVR